VDPEAVALARLDARYVPVPDEAVDLGEVAAWLLPWSSTRISSTRSAMSEKSAKFTPVPS